MSCAPSLVLALLAASGSPKLEPLKATDFKDPLACQSFHDLDASLAPEAAAAKWKVSAKNSSKLSRAYPDAFWADLRQVKDLLPGGTGPVFGDLHVDNFEFVKLGHDQTIYGYGDFSNSGIGHVSADALREFVNLRLTGASDKDVHSAIDRYVDGLNVSGDSTDDLKAPKQFTSPDWKELREHRIAKMTKDDDRFDYDNPKLGLAKVDVKVRSEIEALGKPGGPLAEFEIHDVATYDRVQGSTGGYARYWVLAERGGKPAVLELGEAIRPAVTLLEGDKGQPTGDQRLTKMQETFWGSAAKHDYFNVKLGAKNFTVRDRLRMSLPEFEKLDGEAQRQILNHQADLTARVHAPGWKGLHGDAIKRWLWESSLTVANRWERVAKIAKQGR